MIVEQFDPGARTAMMANFPGAITALLELVDNGVDDWEGNVQEFKPIRIDIDMDPPLKVLTRGQTGMGLSEIEDFLRWGYSKKRGRIGQWGQGGKAGMGYLANGMRIRTGKGGESVGWVISDPQWGSRDYIKELEPESFPKSPDVAFVEIELFDLKRQIRPETLIKQLGNVYRPLLESGRVKMTVKATKSRRPVFPVNIPLRPGSQEFDVPLSGSRRLRGWVGLLGEPFGKGAEVLRGGARCFHFGRLVSQGEYFGHPKPDFRATLNSLIAEVYIDFPISPHLNKTDFDKESAEWTDIHQTMHQLLKPWVSHLLEECEEEVSVSEKDRASRALNLISRAFRQLDAISRGRPRLVQVAAGQLSLGDISSPKEMDALAFQPGDEFAPSGLGLTEILDYDGSEMTINGGNRISGNGDGHAPPELPSLDYEVQPGDGRLRSTIKVLGGGSGEDERRVIVAYSNYPAYQAAKTKGDLMLYMMETFVFELAKPKIDEVSDVVIYKERADAALGLAAQAYMRGMTRSRAFRSS